MQDTLNILRIVCADQQGLVAKVTNLLYHYQCNIVENDEFVDLDDGYFFMRTAFDGDVNNIALADEIRNVLPAGAQVRCFQQQKKRIVVFATKEAHCLGDILVRSIFNDINADVEAVVSNHDHLGSMTRNLGFPYHFISHKGLDRLEHEQSVIDSIEQYDFDFIVMAKYMRILSGGFINRYQNRIVNIHHSFLPAFAGANPYRQAYERGVKIIGATAHFATEDLDEGPIIAQGTVPVDHSHNVQDMIRSGRDVEKTVLARALNLVFEDRVFVHGNRTIVFG